MVFETDVKNQQDCKGYGMKKCKLKLENYVP